MAIDTAAERRAAGGVVTPSVSVGAFWRSVAGGVYWIDGVAGATTWRLQADLDRDGTFETDLTGYVPDWAFGWQIVRGIDPDGVYQASTFAVELDNSEGEFTPENPSALFYGQFAENPDAPIRLLADIAGNTYTAWAGYVHDLEVSDPADGLGTAKLLCRDLGQIIAEAPLVYLAVSTTRTVTDALEAVADYIGIPAAAQVFDTDARVLPFHFAVAMAPMDALMDIVRSSYGGLLFIDGQGRLRYISPLNRLGAGAEEWGDGSDIVPAGVEYAFNRFDFVTSAVVRQTAFYEGQQDADLFVTKKNLPIALAAGEVWQRDFDLGAFLSYSTPVASRDYLANTAQDFTGTDVTADLDVDDAATGTGRIVIRLENTTGAAMYVWLRIRGVAFEFVASRPEAKASLPVSGMAAGKELQADIPFGDTTGTIARDYAVQLLRTYRRAYPRLQLTFEHTTPEVAAAMLAADLGTSPWFTDRANGARGLYIADWWHVVGMELSFRPTDVARTTVTLVPATLARNPEAIVYDEFDRANASGALGTSTSLHAWSGDSGFDIASNEAVANTDSESMATLALGAVGQVIETVMENISTGDEVGVVLRYTDANNQLRAYLDKGSNQVILEQNAAGVVTELAAEAFTVGTVHEIGAEYLDGRVRVFVDGVRRIEETGVTPPAGGSVGIFARNASGTTQFSHVYGQALEEVP